MAYSKAEETEPAPAIAEDAPVADVSSEEQKGRSEPTNQWF